MQLPYPDTPRVFNGGIQENYLVLYANFVHDWFKGQVTLDSLFV
jgi:hypothetical protein